MIERIKNLFWPHPACWTRLVPVAVVLLAIGSIARAGVGTIQVGWQPPKTKMCTAPAAAAGQGCDTNAECGAGGVCSAKRCTAGTSIGIGCAIGSDCGTGGICKDIGVPTGYEVAIGTASGTYGTPSAVALSPLQFTYTGLDDCRDYYPAVRATNASGSGRWKEAGPWLARVRVDAIAPVNWVVGGTAQTLVVTGVNFRGAMTAALLQPVSGPAIAGAVNVANCTTATVTFNIPADATPGPRVLRLTSVESSGEASGLTLAPVVLLIPDVVNVVRLDPR